LAPVGLGCVYPGRAACVLGMAGFVGFSALLAIGGFLAAAWAAARVSKFLGVSAMALEIVVGIALGPGGLALIDADYITCQLHQHASCKAPEDLATRLSERQVLHPHLEPWLDRAGGPCDTRAYEGGGVISGVLATSTTTTTVVPHGATSSRLFTVNVTATTSRAITTVVTNAVATTSAVRNSQEPTLPVSVVPTFTTSSMLSTVGVIATTSRAVTNAVVNGTATTYTSRNSSNMTVLPNETGGVGASNNRSNSIEGSDTANAANSSSPSETGGVGASNNKSNSSQGNDIATAANSSSPSETGGVGASNNRSNSSQGSDTSSAASSSSSNGSSNSNSSNDSIGTQDAAVSTTTNDGRNLSAGRMLESTAEYASLEECLRHHCEANISEECSLRPDAITVIGHAGVALMLFESGLHFDPRKAVLSGGCTFFVALVAAMLPAISGALLLTSFGEPLVPGGLVVGVALVPSSVGAALKLLSEVGVVQHDVGKIVLNAAAVVDVLALFMLCVVFSVGDMFDPVSTIVLPAGGFVFTLAAAGAAVVCTPRILEDWLLPWGTSVQSISRSRWHIPTQDELLFVLMAIVLFAYASITHLFGTHLWGCWIAGMAFACLGPERRAHSVWVRQTKRITTWMVRIFFACTVAFSLPVSTLFAWGTFWKGVALGVGPCISARAVCGVFLGCSRSHVVGWAMVGRAELAYLIVQMAHSSGRLSDDGFCICVWALLYASLSAPFFLRCALGSYVHEHGCDIDGGTKMQDDAVSCAEGGRSAQGVSGDAAWCHEEALIFSSTGAKGGLNSSATPPQDLDVLKDLESIKLDCADEDEEGNGSQGLPMPGVIGKTEEADMPWLLESCDETNGQCDSSDKKSDSTRSRRPASSAIFPGARPMSHGFLCCLFFRRIVVD